MKLPGSVAFDDLAAQPRITSKGHDADSSGGVREWEFACVNGGGVLNSAPQQVEMPDTELKAGTASGSWGNNRFVDTWAIADVVVVISVDPDASGEGGLATTGQQTWQLWLLGAVLVTLGVGAFMFARRRIQQQ